MIDPATIDNISNGYSEDYQDFVFNSRPTCTENYITNIDQPEEMKTSVYPDLGDIPQQFEIPESCERTFKISITDTQIVIP